jgi:hypothetical protein
LEFPWGGVLGAGKRDHVLGLGAITVCGDFNGFSNPPDKEDIDPDILHGSHMEVVECGRKWTNKA